MASLSHVAFPAGVIVAAPISAVSSSSSAASMPMVHNNNLLQPSRKTESKVNVKTSNAQLSAQACLPNSPISAPIANAAESHTHSALASSYHQSSLNSSSASSSSWAAAASWSPSSANPNSASGSGVVRADLLLTIPNVKIFRLHDGTKTLITEGALSVLFSSVQSIREVMAGNAAQSTSNAAPSTPLQSSVSAAESFYSSAATSSSCSSSSPSSSSSASSFAASNVSDGDSDGVVLLQVNDWTVLVSRSLPCVQMTEHSFVFPALAQQSVGIVFSESTDGIVCETFADILRSLSTFKVYMQHQQEQQTYGQQEPPSYQLATATATVVQQKVLPSDEERKAKSAPNPAMVSSSLASPEFTAANGHKVARSIDSGSVAVASGLIRAGRLAGAYLSRAADFAKSKMKKGEQMEVSDSTKSAMQTAKAVSAGAVFISRALLKGALAVASTLTQELSAVISDTELGRKLKEKNSPNVEAAKDVAVSTLQGAFVIFGALEEAGLILLKDAASATVGIVEHKYGIQSADVARDAAGIALNLGTASVEMKRAGVKSIVKTVVKDTTANVLRDDPIPDPAAPPLLASAAAPPAAAALNIDPNALQSVARIAQNAAAALSASAYMNHL